MELSLALLAQLGGPQSPTLLQCSVRPISLCCVKGKKALSAWVLGAWLAVLWKVNGSQFASLTWMTEVPSLWEADSLHMHSMNQEGVSFGRGFASN